jgi:hypothetical protein
MNPSFPRRRESKPAAVPRSQADWIPAFAGMTEEE